jgi:hypothetical protein
MLNSFAIIAFAALIHTSFQLSVSMLTLMSGHAIGNKSSHAKLLRLTNMFSFGVALMTVLLISVIAFVLQQYITAAIPPVVWASVCGLLIGLGVAVWAFYYRRTPGTSLWLPRGMARYLSDRTKSTKQSAEAFSLGMSSVIAEFIFIFAPMTVSALALLQLDPGMQIVGVALYAFISLLSLLVVNGLIGSGHKLSRIQKWREDNKLFLQFAAGSGLLILGFYLYVDKIIAVSSLSNGVL